ncbi:MAG: DnaJ domain-containing protein [bacterium]|nr:DnaJ domain-containing protein [bacterium]
MRRLSVCLSVLFYFFFAFPVLSQGQTIVDRRSYFEVLEKIQRGALSNNSGAIALLSLADNDVALPPSEVLFGLRPIKGMDDALYHAVFAQIAESSEYYLTVEQLEKLETLSAFFLNGRSEHVERVRALIDFYKFSRRVAENGTIAELRELRSKVSQDERGRVLDSLLTVTAVTKGRRSIANGDNSEALRYLSLVDGDDDDIRVAEVARNALAGFLVSGGDVHSWPFSEPEIAEFVFRFERGRENIRGQVRDILARDCLRLVKAGDSVNAVQAFRWLIERRPDPDSRNNQLRYDFAYYAGTSEMIEAAQSRIVELEHLGALSISQRLELLYRGFYGPLLPFSLTVCLAIIIISSAVIIYRYYIFRMPKISRALSEDEHDEYSRLLARLGLEDLASGHEIKKRFREISKMCHPDKISELPNRNQIEKEYMDAKSAYERIIEIRRGWFSGGL